MPETPNERSLLVRGGGFRAEDAMENRVDRAQLALQIESMRERLVVEKFADVRRRRRRDP